MDENETLGDIFTEMGWRIDGLYDSAGVFSPSEVRELSRRIFAAHRRDIEKLAKDCIRKLEFIKKDVEDHDNGKLTAEAALGDIGQTCDMALPAYRKLLERGK